MTKVSKSSALVKDFKRFLPELRNKHGLSQHELAKRSGLTQKSIAFIESGQQTPTFSSIIQLAKGFNMRITEFISCFFLYYIP